MDNEIISYLDMCQREGASLQKGMNFLPDRGHSVVLMSLRPNAPYRDRIEDEGRTLIYEGHDAPRRTGERDPKTVDQPEKTPAGRPTENGRFHAAARAQRSGRRAARRVRVYEKLRPGIWTYNGVFDLLDSWRESDGARRVFKFKLQITSSPAEGDAASSDDFEHRRLIPSSVKMEVFRRDGGHCVKCGADDGLHFDHVLPYSRGGSSVTAENIQLLCARHNLEKGARIV